METSYQRFDGNAGHKKKINKIALGLLIITCILLIVASIIAGIYGTKLNNTKTNNDDSSDNNTLTTKYCTTTQCLQLAADITQTINTSVDPCHDFYHFVCDGWIDDNSWINIDTDQYQTMSTVAELEKKTFLDELFYNTKPNLVNYSSVQKATAYFQTCYDSELDIETAQQSQFIAKLINQTTFFSNDSWDTVSEAKFQNVITYLTQNNFNTFFILECESAKVPKFIQNFDFMTNLPSMNLSEIIPLYQSVLGLPANTSQTIATLVQTFAWALFNISTITDPRYALYPLPGELAKMSVKAPFNELSTTFKSNKVLDYTQLVYDAYGISQSDPELTQFQYYEAALPYFQGLGPLIQQQNPAIVQFYIWTSVLYYYLDFAQIFSQSRYTQRSDFCFDRTKDKFPFVYGYILYNKLYTNSTYTVASTLAKTIKIDGTQALIENATWLDDISRAAALKKIQNMDLYIGFPPRMKFGDNIDKYYKVAKQSMSVPWIDNVESLTQFEFKQFNDTFWGNQYNLTVGWPSLFTLTETYNSWLTGINAFYFPLENWFTIPATISQPPLLDSSKEYPSSMIFGGLGGVCGHEMSHGFDPSGSTYNYNGTMVGSIFTNYSQSKYNDNMACFINQYNNIGVDMINGSEIYVNGTFTITENVADNAGVFSSWTAWRKYISENGNDKLLYGVDFSQEQMFFVGWTSLWCDSTIKGSVVIGGDIHSPNYARVIGPLQNNPHFASAFDCDVGTRMNPKEKCTVW